MFNKFVTVINVAHLKMINLNKDGIKIPIYAVNVENFSLLLA